MAALPITPSLATIALVAIFPAITELPANISAVTVSSAILAFVKVLSTNLVLSIIAFSILAAFT